MASTNGAHRTGRAMLIQRVVFGALAVLCLVGWFLVRSAAARADLDATRAAEARADKLATAAVAGIATVDGGQVTLPSKAFADGVRHDIGSDPSFARVRVWDAAGAIVATTDPADRSAGPHPATGYRDALRGDASAEKADGAYTPLNGDDQVSASLLQTYVPLRSRGSAKPIGAVEVDYVATELVSPSLRLAPLALAIGAALFGALFVFSMTRRSKKRKEPPALKQIEPPNASATVRHDFGAAKRPADHGWVIAPSDAPPPTTSVAELESATSKIAELERALQRAADENELVRSQAASQEVDIERLRREANERVAALEQQVSTDGPEIEALRAKLVEAQGRASEAESLLATAHEELAVAHAQVGDTRMSNDEPPTDEPVAEPAVVEGGPESQRQPEQSSTSTPEPEPEPTDPTDLIAVLEARVAEAEARAQVAKEEAMQLSPEASELRVRLARTAARKKMGSSTASG